MKILHRSWVLVAALGLLSLSACVSLAADVTPPPDYVPPVAAPTDAAVELALPMVPSDPQAGKSLYAEKCLPCHGETGRGDGFQASNLPNPPPVIGGAELARSARPAEWYAVVTQGNLQKMMPGFGGSLSDRQRWDVVAYVFSLSMSSDSLAAGAEIYAANCQQCHGKTGRGDGAQAASLGSLPDWTEPARLAQLSGNELRAVILSGKEKMPGYADKLDDSQVWAVTDYIRSLSFATAPQKETTQPTAEPAGDSAEGTPVAAAAPAKLTITGRIVNASGGEVPAGLKVNLLGYDNMQPALQLSADAAADGSFTFDNLDYAADRVFLATTEVNGRTFNSDVLHASDVLPGADSLLMLHIYDTTTDTSALVADRLHIFFDFSKAGVVQVGELMIVSNTSKNLIVAAQPGEPVIRFKLPEGAANLNFQDGALGERFVETSDGFGDTLSIPPGNSVHQVLFAYELPYERKLKISLAPPLAVTSAIVIVPAGGVRVQGEQLQDSGERSMQGVSVHLYTAGEIGAGNNLEITLSGRADSGSGVLDVSSQTGIFIGLGTLLLVLAGVGVWFWRRRQAEEDDDEEEELEGKDEVTPASVESLVDAIVALDDQYQSGQLGKEAYEERRASLKDQLRAAREQTEM